MHDRPSPSSSPLARHAVTLTLRLPRLEDGGLIGSLPESLLAMLEVLHDGECLQLLLTHEPEDLVRPLLQFSVLAPADAGKERREALARELRELVRLHFRDLPADDGMAPLDATFAAKNAADMVEVGIAPRRGLDWTQRAPGPRLAAEGSAGGGAASAPGTRLPRELLALEVPPHMQLALRGLARRHRRVAIRLRMERARLTAAHIRELRDWLKQHEARLEESPLTMPAEERRLAAHVRDLLQDGWGYSLRCAVLADGMPDEVVLDHISQAFYGSAHDARAEEGQLPVWPAYAMILQGLLPAALGIALWSRHAARPLPPAEDAIVLGTDINGHELHLSLRDRARHVYIQGMTGTGKSTLMLNMMRQDMEAGRCVIVFDPHGDLWEQARRVVPEHRRDDVQLCHLGDERWSFTVNVLAGVSGNGARDAGMVVNALYDLFKRIVYKDIPEAFGPVFESLFRNSLTLLLKADHPHLTLAHLQRVFTDRRLRDWLLERVDDEDLHDFWKNIFPNLSGDWDEANLTFYATSKIGMFMQNPLLRPILTAPRGTLSFGEVMEKRRICLINLAKGQAGARDSSFIAGLLSLRLAMAAMAQGRRPERERATACVYMDEFHNYASYVLADMLAETRKYGLHITLAHQTMSQIDDRRAVDDLRSDVLANTGSKFIFRTGHADAVMLEHLVAPHFGARDLTMVDDHHMVACALEQGRARPPVLVRTPQPPRFGEPVPSCVEGASDSSRDWDGDMANDNDIPPPRRNIGPSFML